MKENLATLKRECAAIGRDFSKLDITVMGPAHTDRGEAGDEMMELAELGVGRYVFALGTLTPENYQKRLEQYATTYLI
jgi:hypothetical protein